MGVIPLLRGSSSDSRTNPTAPEPTIIPPLLLSNGTAAFDTSFSVVSAPRARRDDPSHSMESSFAGSSAPRTMTLLHLPVLIQSWAMAMARVVEAQAEFTCVLGPFAFIYWANCEWAIARIWNIICLGIVYDALSL